MSYDNGRYIFTHNNADFDAIAALLGMSLLDDSTVPVLPPRLRQNVRNFLTLYAGVLPAIHFEEVAGIEQHSAVYLVDTQNFQTIPGIQHSPVVHIIDHHPIAHDFPPHYTTMIEQVGATATLLTEMLQRQQVSLRPLEATLLLLGIYEDCGSLTYTSTTTRDVHAVAWLLAQGGNLDILREFLSYPLQPDQWQIVDLLRETMQIREIERHTILVATAELEQQVEGVSRVAHQMMNLYDPSALVILVRMGADVQMVARSTIDEINVGMLAQKLGGGGHRRAAAAVMRHTPLSTALQRLEKHIASVVTPGVTVTDLMSYGRIQTVDSAVKIADAARLMQISGHEGYPVLQDGQVVGLLTRRAVDRAMNHQLGEQPVHQIMEASTDIYVYADDSLETLRQQMMGTGWGQIPVLDENNGLLGIVTRTDLLRHREQSTSARHMQQTFEHALQRMLPDGLWTVLETMGKAATQTHTHLYLVGGLVRDLLLNTPNLDLDMVVEGDAIAFAKMLHHRYGGKLRIHEQFGTAKWLLSEEVAMQLNVTFSDAWPEYIDFATARAEFYKEPTVLPAVRQSSIKQDLHRRDFTINSMAIRLSPPPPGTLIDYYNGVRDLNSKIVRVLHSLSFVDDPTRMLRAVRFEQRFRFQIEPRTEALLHDALPFLKRVTGERLKNELLHLLEENNPLAGFHRLWNLGILQQISPAIRVDAWFAAAFETLTESQDRAPWDALDVQFEIVGLGLLVLREQPSDIAEFSKRLMLSRNTLQIVERSSSVYHWLAEQHNPLPSDMVAHLETVDATGWFMVWVSAATASNQQSVLQFVTDWRFINTSLDGHQLKAMGVSPGPHMGKIIQYLRNAWLDGDIVDAQSEQLYLQQLLNNSDDL